MKVVGKNFDLVTIRAKGTTQGGSSSTINGLLLDSTSKLPYEYHHIVRKENVNEGFFNVKLEKKKKGMFSKEIVGVYWSGGCFASTLNSDPEINAAIMKFITCEDGMKIEADKNKKIIRVIFSRPSVIGSGLKVGFNETKGFAPKETVDVIYRIAGFTR